MTLAGALAASLAVLLIALAATDVRLPAPRVGLERRVAASAVLAGVVGTLVAAALGVAPIGPVAAVLPWWWRGRAAARALAGAEASVVPVLETAVAGARAGIVLVDAVAQSVPVAGGELRTALDGALARSRLGESFADALAERRVTVRSADVAAVLDDFGLCARARLGADDVAAFLEDVLARFRFERELRTELRARTAGQRFQVWLLAAVVPALAVYLSFMSPTLAAQLASPFGQHVLIPAGLAFELGGIFASRRVLARATCA